MIQLKAIFSFAGDELGSLLVVFFSMAVAHALCQYELRRVWLIFPLIIACQARKIASWRLQEGLKMESLSKENSDESVVTRLQMYVLKEFFNRNKSTELPHFFFPGTWASCLLIWSSTTSRAWNGSI